MATIPIPKGDRGFDLPFIVQDSDGNAYNLTDYTIKLKVWVRGTPGTLKVNGSCSITDAATGKCKYAIQATDFTTVTKYMAELELTKPGIVESTETFEILVTESG